MNIPAVAAQLTPLITGGVAAEVIHFDSRWVAPRGSL